MNEKERILELVKKEVISMQEGLALLEKLNDKKEDSTPVTPPVVAKEQGFEALIPELQEKNESSEEPEKETVEEEEEPKEAEEKQFEKTFQDMFEQLKPHATNIKENLVESFRTVKNSVKENVDWKDINLRVPTIASTPFHKEYTFEGKNAAILDVQNANGKIECIPTDEASIKVVINGKIYANGQLSAEEEFENRSTIEATEEKLTISIPMHRMKADVEVYLPKRFYDHVSMKSMNGDILLGKLEFGDVYLNSTNGSIISNVKKAGMFEIKGVNGNIDVEEGTYMDILINTVNSKVIVKAETSGLKVGLVNGEMKVTLNNDTLKNVQLTNVNGTIKVAFPRTLGLDGEISTAFGRINHRLEEIDLVTDTNKKLKLTRSKEQLASFNIRTTTGNIYVKDAE